MGLRKSLDDLGRSQSQLESEELAVECSRPGCTPIAQVQARAAYSVTGTVHSIAVIPSDQAPELHIELFDGTGILDVIWMGRREIEGIRTGAFLTLTGRVTMVDGRRTIFNPGYQMLPEHA